MLTDAELEGLATEEERNVARAFAAAFDHLPPQRALQFIAYMRALWAQQRRRAFRIVEVTRLDQPRDLGDPEQQ